MKLGTIFHLLGTFFPIFPTPVSSAGPSVGDGSFHASYVVGTSVGNGSVHTSYAVGCEASAREAPVSGSLRKHWTGRLSFWLPLGPGPLGSVLHPVTAAIFSLWGGEARNDVG